MDPDSRDISRIQGRNIMERQTDREALIDTIDILNNPKTMEIIERSESDIVAGRVKEISSVDDLMSEIPR